MFCVVLILEWRMKLYSLLATRPVGFSILEITDVEFLRIASSSMQIAPPSGTPLCTYRQASGLPVERDLTHVRDRKVDLTLSAPFSSCATLDSKRSRFGFLAPFE